MELTERERLILVEKKEEIRRLTVEILDIASNPENALEIKKKFTSILSLLNTIASYSNSRNVNLDVYTKFVTILFNLISEEQKKGKDGWRLCQFLIEIACNFANAARFNFTKRGVKIYLPKIDIHLFEQARTQLNHR